MNSLRLLLGLLLLAMLSVAAAQNRIEGTLPDRAGVFRIDVPANWRAGGRLIIYNHGFSMQDPDPSKPPNTAPDSTIRQFLLDRGYALAAGSYTSRGWAVFDLGRSQRVLLDTFRERVGQPGELILFGGSLGGLVSALTAESFAAQGIDVAAVYSLCAPLGGSRTWDQAVDTRLLFDAVCPESPLPAGSTALPWVLDYADIPSNFDSIDSLGDLRDPELLLRTASAANRVRQCTGLFQPAMLDTNTQLQRRAQLKSLLGLTRDDSLKLSLAYAISPLADLIQAPEKLAGRNPFDNRGVDYGDATINNRVLRIAADPLAAVKLRALSDPTGAIGRARILALHGSSDELVFPAHLSAARVLAPASLATAMVRDDKVAHCGFSHAELLAGFDALRDWIDRGTKPDATSLQQRCQALGGSQRCAFDASLTPAPLDQQIKPRQKTTQPVFSGHSGAWYDPAFAGEGVFIEVLADQRTAVVAWYTYPGGSASGEQDWIVGTGRITEDGIFVEDARRYRGARFNDFRGSDAQGARWGELTFWFNGCGGNEASGLGVGRLRYSGPTGWGSGERNLFQLTYNGNFPLHCRVSIPERPPVTMAEFSGTWHRPNNANDGIIFQVQDNGLAVLSWYTYDPAGNPTWLLGTADTRAGLPLRFNLIRPVGTRFGNGFDRNAVQQVPWGTAELQFGNCAQGQLSWQPTQAGWNAGSTALQRLTQPAGVPRCTP